MSFIKLDVGILTSTLWTDEPAHKIMEAAALKAEPWDFDAPVEVLNVRTMKPDGWSIPPGWYGFARVAGPWLIAQYHAGTIEERWAALERLCSPEAESRSKDFDGRRMARVDGGYVVFNYIKYRDRDHSAADRMRRFRGRKKKDSVTGVTRNGDGVTRNVTHSREAESREAEEESVGSRSVSVPSREITEDSRNVSATVVAAKPNFAWSKEACDLWMQRFGGTAPGGEIGKTMLPVVTKHGWPVVRAAWISYLAQTEAQYASPTRFAKTFGKWAGTRPDPPQKDDPEHALIEFLNNTPEGREMGHGAAALLPKWPGGSK